MSKKQTHRRGLTSVLPVLILLVLGFFNASGHVISTNEVYHTRTELLFEQKNSIKDSPVPKFEKYDARPFNRTEHYASLTLFTHECLISYNNFISVRLHSQWEKLNSFNTTHHFLLHKSIPNSSDDPHKS